MDLEEFELLLAMMRQLRSGDSSNLPMKNIIENFLSSMRPFLTSSQEQALSAELEKYNRKLSLKKKIKEAEEEIEKETYDSIVNEFYGRDEVFE
jgi:hypothetical protein